MSTQRRAASSQSSFPPPPPLVYASLEPSVSAAAILYVSGVHPVWRAGICGGAGGGADGVFGKLKPKKTRNPVVWCWGGEVGCPVKHVQAEVKEIPTMLASCSIFLFLGPVHVIYN